MAYVSIPMVVGKNIEELQKSLDVQRKELEFILNSPNGYVRPILENGWLNFESGYESAGFYRDIFGRVYIVGMVKEGVVGSAIFKLPPGYRPTKHMNFIVACKNETTRTQAHITVYSDGRVSLEEGANTWVDLGSISFKV
jgi:hypothetical protein